MDQSPELDQLLQQFCQLEDDDDLQAFLQDHHAELLTEEAETQLAHLAQSAPDETQRAQVNARLQLVQALRLRQAMADLPPAERLFVAFMAARNRQDINSLVLQAPEADLDELEELAGARQADMEAEEQTAVQQRLADLRQSRQQLQATFGERVPLFKRLNGWIQTDSWPASAAYLQAHADELLADAAEQVLLQLLEDAPDNPTLQQHQTLLQESRTLGIEQAYANRAERAAETESSIDPDRAQALADKLAAWIQQETMDEAEAYLRRHQADLLSDEGAAVMEMLVQANTGNPQVRDHRQRLARAREVGVDEMYAGIRRERLQESLQEALTQQGPLGQAVYQFVQIKDDETAAALLQTQEALLLTWDAGNLLNQLLAAATDAGDETTAARLQRRLQQWQAKFQVRAGTPLRAKPSPESITRPEAETVSPETSRVQERQEALRAEMRSKYTVLDAQNCAIGDNAMVVNHIERIPIRWQQPQETRSRLAKAAVGREKELAELHDRLIAHQGTVVVSQGTSAAVRGQPAIGKTTLAAMYATRYADHYGGGVLWLDIGPQKRTAADAIPILQRVASYAYENDARAQEILENCQFSANRVHMLLQILLRQQGPLLVVIDDVWQTEVLVELQQAFPADCYLLLTTRDYDVAFSLEETEAAIQPLDVLSPKDARLLLQEKVRGLTQEIADRLAVGLGYHAQALVLAAGALSARKKPRHQQTAEEILERVATGRGFGDLPRMDKAERLTKVEIALKYSYDYLAEIDAQAQQRFRALGVFAQEAEFDTLAVTALWEVEDKVAEEFLLTLEGLALVEEVDAATFQATTYRARWQQHAIIRAYALSLQTTAERMRFPGRHVDYYINLAQACHDSRPRAYDRLEQEFSQLQHAFDWCVEYSPIRVVTITNILSQFMTIRGRSALIHDWLMVSQKKATILDDRLGKANTLRSLGDLERRLGNVEQARQHYNEALPLYEAEQARLGKANTLRSLGDLESRLGNVEQARQHYNEALPLYEAEQARLGKANTLISLGDLESRLGNVEQARQHYNEALPLYEAEQDRLGKANTLKSLGDLESRLGNVEQARQHYNEALPLYEAEQDRLGKANTLISLGDLESRLGNVEQARQHYNEALPLYEAEQDRLGKANTLKSLGDLESRLGNVEQAQQHYNEALPLYEAEQARLGKANTLISLGDLERRLGNVEQARQHYNEALPLYEAEQDRLGKANTLKSLGDLESRLGNVEQARQHYNEALPLYEAEQARLGKANTLRSLGDLESRLGNVEQARQHYNEALPLYEAEQDPVGRMNVWMSEARLAASQGDLPKARHLYEAVFTLAGEIGFADHPVIQDLHREYAYLNQGFQEQVGDADDQPAEYQALAGLLIDWIKTPDWPASQAYLAQHAGQLLTGEAEQALQRLQQANPDVAGIPQHLALLRRCRAAGIDAAYQELEAMRTAAQDPALQAMQALLQVTDAGSFEAAVKAHPTLKELATLQRLTGAVLQSHRDEEPALARHLLALLLSLFQIYDSEHAEQIEPEAQEQFIELHDALLPVAEELDNGEGLPASVRESSGWALNTLGNYYAQQKEHIQAVESYSRAIAAAPQTAMLYRNRAGQYLEQEQVEAARQDIEQAAQLEPEAARLPELWCGLYLALGDGPAMLPYIQQLEAAGPDRANHHYYQALAQALAGDMAEAKAAMTTYSQRCSNDERAEGLRQLAQLQERQPALASAWQELIAILQDKSNPTEETDE